MRYDFDTPASREGCHLAKYDEMKARFGRDDLVPMWIADMDFITAQPVVEALRKRGEAGLFGYVSRPDSYFTSVSEWFSRRHGWHIDTSWMCHSPGVVPGLVLMIEEFTEPGDSVIIQPPVYHEFFDIVENTRRTHAMSHLKLENGRYEMDYEGLEAHMKRGAKLLILCNPHNPVGRVWTRDELIRLGELCLKYQVRVISDEIHCDLLHKGKKYVPFGSISPEFLANSITCVSPSKTFNLAGLQSSILVLPTASDRERYKRRMQVHDIHRNNSFSLVGTEAAYAHGDEWLDQVLDYLQGNFDYVCEYCRSKIPELKPHMPESMYLIWIDCRALGLEHDELRDFMINEARVALGFRYGPGSEGFVRMNVAFPRSVVMEAMSRLESAVKQLKQR